MEDCVDNVAVLAALTAMLLGLLMNDVLLMNVQWDYLYLKGPPPPHPPGCHSSAEIEFVAGDRGRTCYTFLNMFSLPG